jgi:enoyl-[acyl-carrier-protein] reductase (NADH)
MAWQVDDIEAVVAELRRRGVVFEKVDVPGLRTVDDIADVAGNYPSAGVGRTMLKRAATLDDVGNVAAFAASDRARTITASALNITCGSVVD